jgi:succinate dehydrogenase / fumarate reductase flavoprotein subunit
VANPTIDLLRSAERREAPNTASVLTSLQSLMTDNVGPFRTEDKLRIAIARLADIKQGIGDRPTISSSGGFDPVLVDWLDLRNMLLVGQTVALPRSLAPKVEALTNGKTIRALMTTGSSIKSWN